jgi:hypothetical protein
LLRLPAAALCAVVLPFGVPAPAPGQAVICLVNAERAARGLPPLREAAPLDVAAARFAAQMVALRFFGHVAPDGSVLDDRVAAAGYAAASVGEDIGEGAGADASPAAAMVATWMDSAAHRANILDPGFRDAGVGVVLGDAGLGGVAGAVTYVLDLAAPAGAPARPAAGSAAIGARAAGGGAAARRCRMARYRRAHGRLCRRLRLAAPRR